MKGGGGKNKNYCPKTLSGKHLWQKITYGIKQTKMESGAIIGSPTYLNKCFACGMIADTKPKENGKK